MNHDLNEELATRSNELAELSRMAPDDRIARIVWSRIQNDLEREDSLTHGIQYCVSNIYHFIKVQIQENEQTSFALRSCADLIQQLGWNAGDIFAKDYSKTVFIDYIKEAVAMYTDTRQQHCEDAQCLLAMNMIHMVIQDIEYVIKKRPAQEKQLLIALRTAANLRNQMLNIFGYQSTATDNNF
ncbi:hypothetical protein SynBIOSE41_03675 [Synechococcus sp. BIOS-E4-1]|uniref:hypothetical protein n=1 Tax=Synechococcus sp. BIOS-E4-1 TaxID=1400864 RepID=UPI0016460488|nr:hypothetical protein [Synechococcus sp. BIOS-E4-1]QNI56144.1 hypothetical protein SynBIOSE41_03675 [Synechococcus sp. BIOS-E4-1]